VLFRSKNYGRSPPAAGQAFRPSVLLHYILPFLAVTPERLRRGYNP